VVQVVECLLSKREAPSSNPSFTKKNKINIGLSIEFLSPVMAGSFLAPGLARRREREGGETLHGNWVRIGRVKARTPVFIL
jgi:hypothetical protein